MNVLPKRIYISKLPHSISKSDVEYKFSHYGKVASVEINHRKNGFHDDQPPFAYVNLETSDEELLRCIRDFANKKWKGEFLDVQIAKESFMARLKREREEEKNKVNVSDSQIKTQNCSKFQSEDSGDLLYNNSFKSEFTGKRKKLYFNGENEVREEKKRKKLYFGEDGEDTKEEVVNHQLLLNGNASKENATKEIQPDDVKKDPKHIEADQKRKSSNIEMRKQFIQQKLQIRTALSNLDGKSKNKKIIFDDDADKEQLNETKGNKQLFDDDDDDDDSEENAPTFAVKPQFEGKEGQKLLQLQSRFKNDKRFVMNEMFLENDGVEENEISEPEDEKQKQLSILEEVLGKKITTTKPKDEKQKQLNVMLRFDPDDPQHKAYEITRQEEEKSITTTKKKKRKETPEIEEEKPEVSKTKFYKVSDNLKDVFNSENKSFSLLGAINDVNNEDESHEIEEQPEQIKTKNVKVYNQAFNNTAIDGKEEQTEEANIQESSKEAASERVKFWSEPFFFKEDDYRFQEGMDFIKRLGSQESTDFQALRHDVKAVVRKKVKMVNKKRDMFKKKLGGTKKRMKMKRALKR